jgi:hypothetical protein
MSGLRLAGTVAAALMIVPVYASASDQDDALRLAQRLATMGGVMRATVALHALPKNFPSSVPLPKATLLGSVSDETQSAGARPSTRVSAVSGGTAGWTVAPSRPVALYYETADRAATVTAYDNALRAAGWTQLDMAKSFPFPRGGFVSTEFPRYDAWCSPGPPETALVISTPARDATALDVSVTAEDGAGQGACKALSGPEAMFAEMMRRSPLPALNASSGVTIERGGPATDGSTSGARVTSSLGLAAVFESFAKQLRDAGWALRSDAGSSGVRAQTFAKTVDGTPYVVLLTVYPLDATHYVALIDLSNQ